MIFTYVWFRKKVYASLQQQMMYLVHFSHGNCLGHFHSRNHIVKGPTQDYQLLIWKVGGLNCYHNNLNCDHNSLNCYHNSLICDHIVLTVTTTVLTVTTTVSSTCVCSYHTCTLQLVQNLPVSTAFSSLICHLPRIHCVFFTHLPPTLIQCFLHSSTTYPYSLCFLHSSSNTYPYSLSFLHSLFNTYPLFTIISSFIIKHCSSISECKVMPEHLLFFCLGAQKFGISTVPYFSVWD